MKKWMAVLVLVLLLGAGLTLASGRALDKNLPVIMAEWADAPGVTLTSSNQQRGLLTSSGREVFSTPLLPGVEWQTVIDWTAGHRPGWISFSGDVRLLLVSDSKTVDLADLLDTDPLAFSGTAGPNKLSYRLTMAPLSVAEEQLQLDVRGVLATGDYHYASRQNTGELSMERLSMDMASELVELHGMQMSWDQTGSATDFVGRSDLSLERIDVVSAEGSVNLHQASLNQLITLNDQTFDWSLALDSGSVRQYGEELGSGKLRVHTQQFDGQAMQALFQLAAQSVELQQKDMTRNVELRNALQRLLAGNPGVVVDELDIQVNQPVALRQQLRGSLDFDATHLADDFVQRLLNGQVTEDEWLNRLRMEWFFSGVDSNLLMLMGLPPALLSDQSEHSVTLRQGELRFNGILLPF